MDNRRFWETEAHNWLLFARTPGLDAYWDYRDAFFDRVVPPPGLATLEVGCGEGRVTRDLLVRGHRVVSIDGSPSLLRSALDLDGSRRYALADASVLPVATASCDLVVAYNSLMDFDDMPGAVAEVARVLRSGSPFCACVLHPVLDAGNFAGDAPDAPYFLRRPYLGSHPYEGTGVAEGVSMVLRGWSHSLEVYASALFAAGFVIDALYEPVGPGTSGKLDKRWTEYPLFMFLRAIKR
jgi:SAM-dependent methyltransferase